MALLPKNLGDLNKAMNDLRSVCRTAWKEGMMAGWSGNASLRLPRDVELILITASGAAKGALKPDHCIVINTSGEVVEGTGRPSSEMGLHLALYDALPHCGAILHGHPVHLQALGEMLIPAGERQRQNDFLNLNLYEAQIWRKRLYFTPAVEPGVEAVATEAVKALGCNPAAIELPAAIWLSGHGICTMGKNLLDALCMAEELEHLAAIQLKCLAAS